MFLVRRVWDFTLDGVAHQVVLQQRSFAPYEILHNGELVYRGEHLLPVRGIYQVFRVAGRLAEVWMVPGFLIEEHYLRIDGEFVFSNNGRKKAVSKKLAKSLGDQASWEKIADDFGFEYRPSLKGDFVFHHRLIGYFSNFLIMVETGIKDIKNYPIPGIFIVVRHHSIDGEKINQIKNSTDLKNSFIDADLDPKNLDIASTFTTLFVPFFVNMTEQDNKEYIEDFLMIIIRYLSPLLEKCEGEQCKYGVGQLLDLVIVNRIPRIMCADCIANIPNVQKKIAEEYKNAPSYLGRGLFYGTIAALLGMIVLAFAIFFIDNSMPAVLGLFIFFAVIKAMDKAGTRKMLVSAALAGLLSLTGVIAGVYLGVVGYLIKENAIAINLEELFHVFLRIIQETTLLRESILFTFLGFAPYGFTAWNNNRQYLKKILAPDVEVFETLRRIE